MTSRPDWFVRVRPALATDFLSGGLSRSEFEARLHEHEDIEREYDRMEGVLARRRGDAVEDILDGLSDALVEMTDRYLALEALRERGDRKPS